MELKKKSLTEIIKEEYVRCASDPIYFLKKYATIQHPTKGRIPFELYDFQEECIEEFLKHSYNIILKSRQLGLSTLVAGYSMWLMLFGDDRKILVIATKQDVAKNLITKVKTIFNNLPNWLKLETVELNKLSIVLSNGSSIKAESSSAEAGRSESLSLLVLDEAAFIDKIGTIWGAAQQTLATGGDCIALSTPNGVGNWYHRQWTMAIERQTKFNPIKLHWTVHPDRTQKWRDEQTKILGDRLAAQECDTDFLSSGQNVIDPLTIRAYEENEVSEPLERRGIDKGLWIWKYADPNKSYIVAADVARGDGEDFSAAHILDVETLEQVAEYKGKISTQDYGDLLVVIATEYNNALLIIERENIGWATIQRVIDRKYPNLFYSSGDLTYVDTLNQINRRGMVEGKNLKPGFSTSSRSRDLIISKLDEHFRDKSLTIRSQRLIDELYVFIWKGGKAQAMDGYNDDLVLALCIGLWVRATAMRLRQEGIELTKMALDRFGVSRYNAIQSNRPVNSNPFQIDTGKGNEDITWLFDRRK